MFSSLLQAISLTIDEQEWGRGYIPWSTWVKYCLVITVGVVNSGGPLRACSGPWSYSREEVSVCHHHGSKVLPRAGGGGYLLYTWTWETGIQHPRVIYIQRGCVLPKSFEFYKAVWSCGQSDWVKGSSLTISSQMTWVWVKLCSDACQLWASSLSLSSCLRKWFPHMMLQVTLVLTAWECSDGTLK